MHEISCEICMDLIPLVLDGAASADSRRAVERHIQTCEICRAALSGEVIPESDPEKSLGKAVKRLKRLSAAVAAVFVLMGICLCELVFQGSSVLFLIAVFLIRLLLGAARKEGKGWKHRLKQGTLILLAVTMTVGLLTLAEALTGNPWSKKLAETAAQAYLEGKFPDSDLYLADTWYDSKRGHYQMEIRSASAVDTHFKVDADKAGNIRFDTYDDVLTGWNTAARLEESYASLTEPVLRQLRENYPQLHGGCSLNFETVPWPEDPEQIQFLFLGKPLIPNGDYDIQALAAQTGKLELRLEAAEVSANMAAKLLLDVRRTMDASGVPFRSIDLTLRSPKAAERLELKQFAYVEIREEGLVQRIGEAIEAQKP